MGRGLRTRQVPSTVKVLKYSTWIDWRTMMLMWKLTTFDSFAASALRREVSSPVSFRSKKAIWVSGWVGGVMGGGG